MTRDDPELFFADGFFGRENISEKIIQIMVDPQARARKESSLLIEGPGGRGKTWLLEYVARWLREHPAQPLVCHFRIKHDVPLPGPQWFKLIARLCLEIGPYAETNDWPFELIIDLIDEAAIADTLSQYSLSALIGAIVTTLKRSNRYCILVIDGLEETELPQLRNFEREIVEPLFSYEKLRILASRRVDSQQYVWSRFILRGQTRPLPLSRFDEETECAISPSIQQIEQLLTASGLQGDQLIAIRECLMASIPGYTWGNPRANRLLIEAAGDHNFSAVTSDDIRWVLQHLMAPPRPIDQPHPEWSDDVILNNLLQIVRGAAVVGHAFPRDAITTLLGMDDRKGFDFLGYLQDRGIGHFQRDHSYLIHTEFVQLLQAL